jgi:hypothetical protein
MKRLNYGLLFRVMFLCGMLNLQPSVLAQSKADQKESTASSSNERRVHFVYMGGNDCPPCIAWRVTDFAKLEKTEIFKQIKYSWVNKTIGSPVPPAFFLPPDVKPLKEKLAVASGYTSGSPHFALLVNDEVVDYWFNTFTVNAEQLEAMLIALKNGLEYPRKACIRYRPKSRDCEA